MPDGGDLKSIPLVVKSPNKKGEYQVIKCEISLKSKTIKIVMTVTTIQYAFLILDITDGHMGRKHCT
ncbi:Hypothetical predicted protein [Octopus vulgaris]|uniref:Uncharacterized protein n=1 Tax=Octopus vulgaris TaxID=6645 RepID=A0AA36AZW6_OCTVU|nr:Hypothetical predicted protein [Octopus vulgaris]